MLTASLRFQTEIGNVQNLHVCVVSCFVVYIKCVLFRRHNSSSRGVQMNVCIKAINPKGTTYCIDISNQYYGSILDTSSAP
jgi:hypothetical protein